jgi:hypothetical protein
MSDLNKLKELANTVDFWGSASGWQPDELHETIHFALKQAERLEVAEAELSRRGEAALPPTVMKPIDLSECRTLWYEHDDLSSEVECIPVMDIKKAIRAAGYQVEGG